MRAVSTKVTSAVKKLPMLIPITVVSLSPTNTLAAAITGGVLAHLYGRVDRMLVGVELPSGAPGYEYELWLVNALLSVTFPFLIVHAAYFTFWPMGRQQAAAGSAAQT